MSAQRTMPLWQRWISANWPWESESSSRNGRDVLFQPRPISASVYSKPPTMSMRTRCCAPVTGLRIGSPRPSVTPGTTKRAPAGDVDLEFDGGEDRLMQFLERGGEHIEDGR